MTAGRTLYVDTMNRASWRSTPQHVDVAIVYPLDALEPVEDECVQDLVSRGAKRVFLVSWTDNKNFDWVDQLKPVRVVYDAEEEDPEYHQRMIKVISETYHERSPGKLPSYAQSTPYNLLVRILCRGHCGTTRWARLDEPFPGTTALKGAKMGEYRATCLVCGYTASDNYNWFR